MALEYNGADGSNTRVFLIFIFALHLVFFFFSVLDQPLVYFFFEPKLVRFIIMIGRAYIGALERNNGRPSGISYGRCCDSHV